MPYFKLWENLQLFGTVQSVANAMLGGDGAE